MKSYVITLTRVIAARLDGIGVLLSALCGLHCIAMPALVASGLLLSEAGETHDYSHYLLFGAAVPVTVLAAWRVFKHQHAPWLLAAAALGIAALWLGLSQRSHDPAATATTLLGATLLAMFHLYHWRLHRRGHAHADHAHGASRGAEND